MENDKKQSTHSSNLQQLTNDNDDNDIWYYLSKIPLVMPFVIYVPRKKK